MPRVTGIFLATTALATGPSTVPAAQDAALERYQQGLTAFRQGGLPEAADCFNASAGQGRGYLQLCAANMLGQCQRLQGQTAEALNVFERMAALADQLLEQPDLSPRVREHARLLNELALHYQAELHEECREWALAAKVYEQLDKVRHENSQDADAGPEDWQAIQTRRLRLLGRTGQVDQVHSLLEKLVSQVGQGPGALSLRVALLSLDAVPLQAQPDKWSWLTRPLAVAADTPMTTPLSSSGAVIQLPDLPHPLDPLVARVKGLLADTKCPAGEVAVLRVRLGWLQVAAGHREAALESFTQASKRNDTADPRTKKVAGYAQLSRALVLSRLDRWQEAQKIISKVHESRHRGHLGRLAEELSKYVHERMNASKNVEWLGVRELK